MGGDEFAAIVQCETLDDVGILAEQFIESIQKPYYVNNIRIMLTCSVGISCYPSILRILIN